MRWSDSDARAALVGVSNLPELLPILDLPAWHDPDDEIVSLCQEYDTVIRLILTDEGRKHVAEEWGKFSADRSLLLFIDGEIEIRWERSDVNSIGWSRSDLKGTVHLEEHKGDHEPQVFRWRCFGEAGAKAAYSINEHGGLITCHISTPRLRAYFPANNSAHPFPNLFLHHAKFRLQSNRESVVPEDGRFEELAQAIVSATQSVKTEEEMLDLLHVSDFPENDATLSQVKVWQAVKTALIDAKLPGLSNRRLNEIKTRPTIRITSDGDPRKLSFLAWEAFLSALSSERPGGLSGLPVLQPGIENERREKTLMRFNPGCSFAEAELRAQEWAPVEESTTPASSSGAIKIFLPHKGEPLNPPEGIQVRFLKAEFVKMFKPEAKELQSFLTDTLGVLAFSALAVIEHCVLPSLDANGDAAADDRLVDFLKKLREADKGEIEKAVASFDWKEPTRRKLAQQLHLHCQGKSRSIVQVYASERWTGNTFLENAYGIERGFLEREPPADEGERKAWEAFWKWLGVGWCPKVLPLLADVVCKSGDKRGWIWEKGRFHGEALSGQSMPQDWNDYCAALRDCSSFPDLDYIPHLRETWTIDGGSDVLIKLGVFHAIEENWPTYKDWTKTTIGYSNKLREDRDNRDSSSFPSYLAWLMRTASWIPGTDGTLHRGRDVFLKSSPVVVQLPRFVFSLQLEQTDSDTSPPKVWTEFIDRCGIRKGWNEVKDEDWKTWLKQASKMKPDANESKTDREAIRALYRALLDHRKLKTGERWNEQEANSLDVVLWGIERHSEAHECWHLHKAGDALPYYVDRGDVADVILPGLRVFPVRLDGLEAGAEKHLKLPLLSKALSGAPTDEGELDSTFSSNVRARLHELIAYLRVGEAKRDDEDFQRSLRAVELRQVSELRVQVSLNGEALGQTVQRNVFQRMDQDQSWTVYVDPVICPEDRRWEVFAQTILLSCGLPTDRALNIRELLRCRTDDISSKLVNLGVAPETVESLKERRSELQAERSQPAISLPELEPPDQPPNTLPTVQETVVFSGSRSSIGIMNSRTTGSGAGDLTNDNGRRPSSRPHPEEGIRAQKWLFDQVGLWCHKQNLPSPLWEKDYMDITIPTSPPIIIEAKRIDGSTIHLSRNQIDHAREPGATFVVALLRPTTENEHHVFWVLRPLEILGNLESRRIAWTWQPEKGSLLSRDSWGPPEPPPTKIANSFKVEISLDDEWIHQLPQGVGDGLHLILLASGVRQPSPI